MEAHNPAADPLRAALMRMAQAPAATAAPAPQGSAAPQAVITPGPGGANAPRVQSESLPAPPRGTR
jgi:hypothetical protein